MLARASFLLAFALSASLAAQRPLSHDDYDGWKSLRGTTVSQDGAWVAYQIEPQWGDGVLEVRSTTGNTVWTHARGSGPRFSADGRFCVFTVGKSKVEERTKKVDELRKKAKEAKEKKEGGAEAGKEAAAKPAEPETPAQEPGGRGGPGGGAAAFGGRRGGGAGMRGGGGPGAAGASETARERGDLAILDLSTGKVEIVPKVKGFTLPEDAAVLVYHMDTPEEEKKDEAKPADGKAGEAKPGEAKPSEAKPSEAKTSEGKPAEAKTEPAAPAPAQPAGGEAKAETAKAEEPKAEAPQGEAQGAPQGQAPGQGRRGRRGGNGGGGGAFAGGPGGRGQGGPGQGGAAQGGPGARAGAAAAPVDPMEKKRKDGTQLIVRDLKTGNERKLDDVVAYGFARKNAWLWYHTSAKKPDAKKTYGLFATKLDGSVTHTLVDGFADFGAVTSDRKGATLAFTCNKDDFAAEKPRSDIWYWAGDSKPAERIVHPGTAGVPKGKQIGSASFSRDGSMLTLSVQDPPEGELQAILPDEKVTLDIWHWNEGQLQTQQQKRGRRDQSRSAVFSLADRTLKVTGDDTVEQVRPITADARMGLGSDDQPYEKSTQWDGRYADVYLVDIAKGTRTKVLERLRTTPTNSPNGRYVIWFGPDYHWWTMDTATQQKRDLTAALAVPFHQFDDDHPEPDPAFGIAGWTEKDESVVLYDEFDLWQIWPSTGAAVCITDGFGRQNHLRLRVQPLPRDDEDDEGALPKQLLLTANDTETMAEGFYADAIGENRPPQRLVMMDKNLAGLTKAKKADRYVLTIGTFAEFPDLWACDTKFEGLRKLSDANPQQKDFAWGKSELVQWVNADGVKLKGVLIKPDGFDAKKKYPMLVYFYEKSSQNLHNYVAPAPGTSPNASYYVSNGYLFFMPDIVYQVGYPGESCVKCVVSGVQSLMAQGYVDEKAIGAAGHSWGGYQTAFLVTRTNIFAAVESGAPVSNMISAYGGIRYETGISRQFQYEQTQSRIGGTPWTHPMRYWENSPIFFADKVQTPVLILHNDNDGAVPWTNGIEYFTALRRLGKESYLFNYNGEPHGLTKRQNMKDWSRRMAEYFGHHLKHMEMPKWMQEGVPYSERDKEKLPFAKSYQELQQEPAHPAAQPEAAKPASKPEAAPPAESQAAPTQAQPAGQPAPAEGAGKATPTEAGGDEWQDPPAKQEPTPKAGEKAADKGKAIEVKPVSDKDGESAKATDAKGAAKDAAKAEPKKDRITLAPGKPAPDFAVVDQDGKKHTLADYQGKTLIVYFYPKADTPGCTAEGCGFRDGNAEFAKKNAAILGVSFDPPAENKAFREKFSFPFPLLCDTDKSMAIAYGAADNKDAMVARRAACVIGPDGKIISWYAKVDAKTFPTTVLQDLPAAR